MVLNMFFGPLTISYDAWMMSHIKLKKIFFALENWSQSDFFAQVPVDCLLPKIEGFKGKPPEKLHFGSLFRESITFD